MELMYKAVPTQQHWKNYGKKQKQAIRIICNANYRAHTVRLFRGQNILPLDQLITYSTIKFMHSYHFKQLPFSFTGVWQTNAERNPAGQLRNAYDFPFCDCA
jgi:hypothetical protein